MFNAFVTFHIFIRMSALLTPSKGAIKRQFTLRVPSVRASDGDGGRSARASDTTFTLLRQRRVICVIRAESREPRLIKCSLHPSIQWRPTCGPVDLMLDAMSGFSFISLNVPTIPIGNPFCLVTSVCV